MPPGEDPENWSPLSWFRRRDWLTVGLVLLGLVYAVIAAVGSYFFGRDLLQHHWVQDDFIPWMIGLLFGGVFWLYSPRIFSRRNRMQSTGTVLLRFSPTARLFDLSSREGAGLPSRFREFSGPDGFWDSLRSALQQGTLAGQLGRSGEFGDFLSRGFGRWWRDIRFTVTSVRYQSLSLGLLFFGTREVFKAIDENPEVFAELFHALAPHALDVALGANVSSWLELDVTIRGRARRRALAKQDQEGSMSASPSVLLIRYFAPLLPILLGLALVFVVAYNTYVESRVDISATAKREDLLLERQEKLLEAQNARIGALESKIGALLTYRVRRYPRRPLQAGPLTILLRNTLGRQRSRINSPERAGMPPSVDP